MQCFSSKNVLAEHREVCLKISGKQRVKLRVGSIKFNNYPKQLVVLFKIYADFESVLKGFRRDDRVSKTSCTKKYYKHIPSAYKTVCIDDRFSKSLVLYREKMWSISLLKQF